jgi:NodT family efflux transporter outer membrane factor (OMF) lipoprotein
MTHRWLLATLIATLPQQAAGSADWQTTATPPELGPAFATAAGVAARSDFTDWWKKTGDPVLAALVTDAFARNLDIQAAVARIDEARAVKGLAKAQLLPEVDFGGSAARQRLPDIQSIPGEKQSMDLYGADVGASWEIDLFGRLRRGARAANADYVASRQDERAVRVALTGDVARLYLAVRGLDVRIAIVRSSAQKQARTAILTRHLFDAGAVPIADFNRAEAEAAVTAAEEPSRLKERQAAIDALAILLALPPGGVDTLVRSASGSPPLAIPDGAGTPADLLRNRPDVRAAEARVLAAYARLGVAEADLKPRLSLQGSVGMLAAGFTGVGLAGTFAWLVGAAVSQPLFDGGRRHREVDLRRADAREAALAYQTAVLHAVSEAEDGLAAVAASRDRVGKLTHADEQARAASSQLLRAWKAGESPFLDVLEVQRRQLDIDDALAIARTDSAQSEVRLVTVLGG